MAGIYIHIPFCKTRCIYCDFYSTTLGGSRSKLFVSKLLEEADERKSFLGSEPKSFLNETPVKTVYIGGGTPSQLDVSELCRLIEGLAQIFDLSQVEELTIEANPEDVTPEWVSAVTGFQQLGCCSSAVSHSQQLGYCSSAVSHSQQLGCCSSAVSHSQQLGCCSSLSSPLRISMGVQSFIDSELQLLHRRHSAEKARQAVQLLQEHGIHNISIDLMYGLPTQTLDSFAYSIEQAIACGTQHISAYNLQVEEGTVLFNLVEEHQLSVADDVTCNAMNELLRSRLSAAGFVQYEISNYCKPGFHSRHNSSYWDGTPYLGLGPGAHSYDGKRLRCWNEPDLLSYLDGNRREGSETLTDKDLYNERIMLGLRTRQGVKLEHVEKYLDKACLNQLIEKGWVTFSSGSNSQQEADATPTHFRLTPSALPFADEVMRQLFIE